MTGHMEAHDGHDVEKVDNRSTHIELKKGTGLLADVSYEAAAEEALKEAENPWTVFRNNPRIVLLLTAVVLNGISAGIEINMAGNVLGIQAFCRQFGKWDEATSEYAVDPRVISIWTACSSPFQLLGMITSGYLGDKIGRRPIMYMMLVVCVGGACLESFVATWAGWLGAKIVMLLTVGLIQSAVSTYISEIAPREMRGVALSTFNLFLNMGNLFSVIISYGTEKRWPNPAENLSFRVPLYVCIALPFLIFLCEFMLLVETPSWLIMHNKHDKARKTMRWLYPKISEDELNLKLAELAYTIAMEDEFDQEAKSATFLDCFKGVDARRSLCAIFPALAQPLCGNMLCGPFATYFFALAGASNALSSSAIVLSVGFLFNIIVFFVIDNRRIGRWNILFAGLLLMLIGNLGIGIVGTVQPDINTSNAAGGLLIFSVCVLAVGSVTGPGAAGWTYTGESGSVRLRAKTNTLGNLGNAAMSWVMGSTVSLMLASWSFKVGFFYAGLSAISMVVVFMFIPDFTGRSYAQVDELFARRIPSREFHKTVCTGNYGEHDTSG